jgi:hypothetical protein
MPTVSSGPTPAPRSTRRQRRELQRLTAREWKTREPVSRQHRMIAWAAASVMLVLVALLAAKLLTSMSPTESANAPVPPQMMADLSGVPAVTFEQVGRSNVATLPVPVGAAVQKGPNGLPLVTYIGAEYCPFCAAERWPLVVSLSRFGTFTGLRTSHSAADDIYPLTPTLSFYGSGYTSRFVEFSAVELQSNVRSGSAYTTLQTPTPAQDALLRTYDGPPYVPSRSAGAIPFLSIANQYVVTGASFDLGLLHGFSQAEIAASLSAGTSDQARAIVGNANALTAALCLATGDAPADVCTQPAVRSLEASLLDRPAPTGAP